MFTITRKKYFRFYLQPYKCLFDWVQFWRLCRKEKRKKLLLLSSYQPSSKDAKIRLRIIQRESKTNEKYLQGMSLCYDHL